MNQIKAIPVKIACKAVPTTAMGNTILNTLYQKVDNSLKALGCKLCL
jgi:hypothetical protein